MRQFSTNKGYTIVELLLVMAIMTILLSVGVMTFRLANAKRDLNQAADMLREQIEAIKTQTNAPAQEITDDELINGGYQLLAKVGSREITIARYYIDSGGTTQIKDTSTINLPSSVVVKEIDYLNNNTVTQRYQSANDQGGIRFKFLNNRVALNQIFLLCQVDGSIIPCESNTSDLKIIIENPTITQTRIINFHTLTGSVIIEVP